MERDNQPERPPTGPEFVTAISVSPQGAFTKKWGATGVTQVDPNGTRNHVQVTLWHGVWPGKDGHQQQTPGLGMRLVTMHEQGHAAQHVHTSPKDAKLSAGPRRWPTEIDAWARAVSLWGPTGVREAQLILDSLNSYRRGLKVSDEEWEDARELVISWVQPGAQPAMRAYVPLEPDEGDPQPEGGDNPDWNYSGGGGDGSEASQDAQDSSEDAPEDGPEDAQDSEDSEDDSKDSEDSEGGQKTDVTVDHFWTEDANAERDFWLITAPGVAVVKAGWSPLERALAEHGWAADDLPGWVTAWLATK